MKEITETLKEMNILARDNKLEALAAKSRWLAILCDSNYEHGNDGILMKKEHYEIQRRTGNIAKKYK